jgi:2-dehydro-3-deoxygalactonokinase
VNRLVAVDWGTSSLRGALLDERGHVLAEHAADRGILTVAPGEFATVFEANFQEWMRTPGTKCLISGMAGSRQGWREAPYCPCPAGFADVAAALTWIEPGRTALVPGLSCERPALTDVPALTTVPDVMRGEEVQVFGALALLGLQDGLFVLPGTHSKWVRVQGGRILGFATCMTGEVYALLRHQSILARTLPETDNALDDAAFDAGVTLALRGPSLLQTAFQVRTLSLFERMTPDALASLLSGLVIGEELRAQSLDARTQVVVMGSGALTRRYARALALCGVASRSVGAEATWQGLHAIAQTLN